MFFINSFTYSFAARWCANKRELFFGVVRFRSLSITQITARFTRVLTLSVLLFLFRFSLRCVRIDSIALTAWLPRFTRTGWRRRRSCRDCWDARGLRRYECRRRLWRRWCGTLRRWWRLSIRWRRRWYLNLVKILKF